MQIQLSPEFHGDREAAEAEAILRSCVHCGFCTATCPTYQLEGNELDGPRGRIYLIKQVFEGGEASRSTQRHLDRCLTCRNCETTCPSGVRYGRLVDIGRQVVDARVQRPVVERAVRWVLNNKLLTAAVAGPRTMEQWQGYLSALSADFTAEDEALVDSLVPAGHPSTPGYSDPAYPLEGRVARTG